MAITRRTCCHNILSRTSTFSLSASKLARYVSTTAQSSDDIAISAKGALFKAPNTSGSPISRMSTATLFRRLFMCTFFTSPILFRTGLAMMRIIANSKSRLLNPDQNQILRRVIKPLVYDQFCAGVDHVEVQKTAAGIKSLGFSGVVICYSKEASADNADTPRSPSEDPEILQWRDGTLATLDMCGPGDWIGIKMTGAGKSTMSALVKDESPTPEFQSAINSICKKAHDMGARIWVDAEQQAVQRSIDKWTIDLMRRWNRGTKPVVYNTIQSYLKESRFKLQCQLTIAHAEGWTYAVKLVRGAYIAIDRSKIHDTKAETDESYEGIVRDLLTGSFPGLDGKTQPKVELLLAGHNPITIHRALTLAQKLSDEAKLRICPEFAQLQGMGDDIGCAILQRAEQIRVTSAEKFPDRTFYVPRVYKCLTWGTIQECMQYLVRRAIENQGATDRIKDDALMFWTELRNRALRRFRTS